MMYARTLDVHQFRTIILIIQLYDVRTYTKCTVKSSTSLSEEIIHSAKNKKRISVVLLFLVPGSKYIIMILAWF